MWIASLERGGEALTPTVSTYSESHVAVVGFMPGRRGAEEAGWEWRTMSSLTGEEDGRLWRSVPNRRWYADQRGATHPAREAELIHHKR